MIDLYVLRGEQYIPRNLTIAVLDQPTSIVDDIFLLHFQSYNVTEPKKKVMYQSHFYQSIVLTTNPNISTTDHDIKNPFRGVSSPLS